jgi:hypothetical protein
MNTNNKPLKIFDKQELYHYVYGVKTLGKNPEMEGDCSRLQGDCTGLRGDCSRLRGDCTGLQGDLDSQYLMADGKVFERKHSNSKIWLAVALAMIAGSAIAVLEISG